MPLRSSSKSETRLGLRDIADGWAHRRSWMQLSRQSISSSYRRTLLGPLWISAQQLAFIVGIGLLYSQLFKVPTKEQIPLVAFGVVIWSLISSLIQGAGSAFVGAAPYIKSSTLPMSFYVFQSVTENILIFFHSFVVIAFVPLIYRLHLGVSLLFWLPLSLLIIAVNGVFISLWLGPLSARYRDIKVGLTTLVQFLLFVSPVFWSPKLLAGRHWAIDFNPVAWFIEFFRSPILTGQVSDGILWKVCIVTLLNGIIGIKVFSRTRAQLGYWV